MALKTTVEDERKYKLLFSMMTFLYIFNSSVSDSFFCALFLFSAPLVSFPFTQAYRLASTTGKIKKQNP